MTTEIKVPENLSKQVNPVIQKLVDEREALFDLLEDLQRRDVTKRMTVELAVEADTRAKAFGEKGLQAFDPMVAVAHQTHRALTTIRGKVLEPVGPLRTLCSRIISDFALSQRKKEEETQAPAQRAEIIERVDTILGGVSTTPKWSGVVTDLLAFIQHIAANPGLAFLLDVRQGDLDKYLTRMKGKIELPGVKVEERMIKTNRNSDDG